ncbi:MAG: GntR family transcriptional regulator [Colwellia sp.]|nr:GntR family transcriptional regulator [Colwellia sp.]
MSLQSLLQFKTLTELVLENLREKIVSGGFPLNERIKQDTLANEFKVSVNTIRGVLQTLQGEGLVTIDKNKGAMISQISKTQINEIFSLKLLIETELLEDSLPHISGEKLTEAKDIINQLCLTTSASNWCELNSRYYHCLYSGAQRPQTQEILKVLSSKIEPYRRLHFMKNIDSKQTYAGLSNLLEQCLQKKTSKAVNLLKQHINSYRDEISTIVS